MLEQGQNSAQNSDDLRKLTVLPVFTSFLSSAAQTALTQTQNRSTLSTFNDSLMLTSKHFLICYTFPLLRLSIYYYCPFISLEADMSVDSICSTMFNFALSSTIGQDIGLRANKSVNDVGSTMATNGADETAKTTSMEEEHNNTGEHHTDLMSVHCILHGVPNPYAGQSSDSSAIAIFHSFLFSFISQQIRRCNKRLMILRRTRFCIQKAIS